MTWSFTLSGVILNSVTFRKGNLRIGKKTSSGVVTVEQERFNISRSDPATLIIYNVTEADEAVYACDVETDRKTWTDEIQVKVGGKSMKNMLVFEHFYVCRTLCFDGNVVAQHDSRPLPTSANIQKSHLKKSFVYTKGSNLIGCYG